MNIFFPKAVATLTFLFACSAHAAYINVQFSSNYPNQGNNFSGGAVIGNAGDQWNYFTASGGSASLNDTSGAATAVTMNFNAQGAWTLGGSSPFNSTPYVALMNSFLYTQGTPVSVMLSGLAANSGFSLYIYGDSDQVAGYGENFNVNGATQTALQDYASTFIANDNYTLFTGTADNAGVINITAAIPSGRYQAMINGLQLVTTDVPEPFSAAIFATGLLALLGVRRRALGNHPIG
ncbi:MAG: hypothetical protein H7251_13025 [Acetobacteraceae bacterium]|nr:hypothetical protein [Acetobacteraceae bacterium]